MGDKPIIYRWSREGRELKKYIGIRKGVSAIAVNKRYLVASGLDDNHYIYIFDLEKQHLISTEKGSIEIILDLAWVSD